MSTRKITRKELDECMMEIYPNKILFRPPEWSYSYLFAITFENNFMIVCHALESEENYRILRKYAKDVLKWKPTRVY